MPGVLAVDDVGGGQNVGGPGGQVTQVADGGSDEDQSSPFSTPLPRRPHRVRNRPAVVVDAGLVVVVVGVGVIPTLEFFEDLRVDHHRSSRWSPTRSPHRSNAPACASITERPPRRGNDIRQGANVVTPTTTISLSQKATSIPNFIPNVCTARVWGSTMAPS